VAIQVEGTRNEEKEEQEDVKEEKGGLEMEDDFEGTLGDVERGEDGENEDSENEEQGFINLPYSLLLIYFRIYS
jgi:hypothetical protein